MRSRAELERVELAARDELAKLVSDMVERMRAGLEDERKKFVELLSSRIKDLESEHAKELARVRKMRESVDAKMERILSSFAAIENSAGLFTSLEEQRRVNDEALADFRAIIAADTACLDLLSGAIEEKAFDDGIDKLVSARSGRKVSDTLSNMKQVMSSVREGRLPLDRAKEWVDKVFRSAMDSLKVIISRREHIDAELVRNEQDWNRQMEFADSSITGADEELTRDVRELGRRGMDIKRFEEELPPDEQEIARRYRRAA
jgi:hypothetical protein